eukprot:TRINITY_DN2816_c0_g1_i6.p1 TRINITY_DN2816_c0_g1~~TRINITY_DN2816_c0_g1_i6.p1  ORF type:complete len:235 (+),score=55.97 TRINITY_DN2816_c0_g1_i6:232-936(+)
MTSSPAPAEQAPEEAKSSPTPIFGSGFGTTGGFAGFTGVSGAAPKKEDGGEADAAEEAAEEEECKAEFTPLVQLEEVETSTGEENEEVMLEIKCKMYRFDKESSEWKERGIGMAKFLKSKESGKIRFLMRQEKTLKIRANHIVMPGTKISSHGGNDKAWVWSAMDFAEEKPTMEMLAIRFGSVEKAAEFKAKYEESMESNGKLLSDVPQVEDEDKADKEAVDELAEKVAETKVE